MSTKDMTVSPSEYGVGKKTLARLKATDYKGEQPKLSGKRAYKQKRFQAYKKRIQQNQGMELTPIGQPPKSGVFKPIAFVPSGDKPSAALGGATRGSSSSSASGSSSSSASTSSSTASMSTSAVVFRGKTDPVPDLEIASSGAPKSEGDAKAWSRHNPSFELQELRAALPDVPTYPAGIGNGGSLQDIGARKVRKAEFDKLDRRVEARRDRSRSLSPRSDRSSSPRRSKAGTPSLVRRSDDEGDGDSVEDLIRKLSKRVVRHQTNVESDLSEMCSDFDEMKVHTRQQIDDLFYRIADLERLFRYRMDILEKNVVAELTSLLATKLMAAAEEKRDPPPPPPPTAPAVMVSPTQPITKVSPTKCAPESKGEEKPTQPESTGPKEPESGPKMEEKYPRKPPLPRDTTLSKKMAFNISPTPAGTPDAKVAVPLLQAPDENSRPSSPSRLSSSDGQLVVSDAGPPPFNPSVVEMVTIPIIDPDDGEIKIDVKTPLLADASPSDVVPILPQPVVPTNPPGPSVCSIPMLGVRRPEEVFADDDNECRSDRQIKEFAYAVEDIQSRVTCLMTTYGNSYYLYTFKLSNFRDVEIKVDLRPEILTYSDVKLTTKMCDVSMQRVTLLRSCGFPMSKETHEEKFTVSYEFFVQLINPTNSAVCYTTTDAAARVAEQAKDTRGINYNKYLEAKEITDTAILAHHYLEYMKYKQRDLDFPVAQGRASTLPSTVTDMATLRSQRSAKSRKELSFFRSIIWMLFVMFLLLPHWASMSWVHAPLMVTLMIFPLLWRLSQSVYLVTRPQSTDHSLTNFRSMYRPGWFQTLFRLILIQDLMLTAGWRTAIIRLPGVGRLNSAINRCAMTLSTQPNERLNELSALLKMSLICLLNMSVLSMLAWMISKSVLALMLRQLRTWFTLVPTLLSMSR